MEDESADADNEGTVVYKRKDMSVANAGRKSGRLSRTAKKTNKRKNKRNASKEEDSSDDSALSAGEMDEKSRKNKAKKDPA